MFKSKRLDFFLKFCAKLQNPQCPIVLIKPFSSGTVAGKGCARGHCPCTCDGLFC